MNKARKANGPADAIPFIVLGDQARDHGRWEEAIAHYTSALALDPGRAGVRIQMGHGLKELGRLAEAEASYRLAAAIRPNDADVYLQIGHVLKLQGRPDDAVEAYVEALNRHPGLEPARAELIAAGRRNLLPDALYGRSAITDALTHLSTAMRSGAVARRELGAASIFPIEAYDAFRQTFPIQPPPPAPDQGLPILVVVEAAEAHPALVRLTLTSLQDQGLTNWIAVVRGCGGMIDHSVSGFADQDARIGFATDQGVASEAGFEGAVLLLDAGLVLEPSALAWFALAQTRTGADLVFCDHDSHVSHWMTGRTYADPIFQSMPDLWDMAQTPRPPAALLVGPGWRAQARERLATGAGQDLRRSLLVAALGSDRRVAHIPRLLGSARIETLDLAQPPAPQASPPARSPDQDAQLIRVIIPTRDEPGMLKACIDSLLAKAARPERVRIEIVDNRSTLRETADLLRSLEAEGRARVDRFDGAFNWARINNLAAARGGDDGVLVFANNDVEMLTDGWDAYVVEALGSGIGVLGVRLLYPDRTVQHAGLVLGVHDLRPVHDGLAVANKAGGPINRWLRPHQASAVTGAFMAMSQAVFKATGGFDERLAIGYNDVDLCLKARELGLTVVYDPGVELIHHESKTRGRQDDAAKVAWDDEELTDLHDRWGGWMMFDPGKNPHWYSTQTRPFDGLRDLGRSEVLRHIDLSARVSPWSIDRTVSPRGEG
ncbi:tetratricopeptide repeat protein [Brevundimonas sp.]